MFATEIEIILNFRAAILNLITSAIVHYAVDCLLHVSINEVLTLAAGTFRIGISTTTDKCVVG
jgi:hypothetical protein